MWAPDVHEIKPFSAFSQLALAFSLLGVFSLGVYLVGSPVPAVRPPFGSTARSEGARGRAGSGGARLLTLSLRLASCPARTLTTVS